MTSNQLSKSIKQVLDSKYVVPLYQRNFAWGREEISIFLQDIYESFLNNEKGHYFIGSLVVLERLSGHFEVIDGQQRLTVICLIAKLLDKGRYKLPMLSYDSRPEVELFLQQFYAEGQEYLKDSNHKIVHFESALDSIKETNLDPKETVPKYLLTLDKLESFRDYFLNNVIIVKTEMPSDTDVAAYFEIMNNRGEQLQRHEILKARLMSKIRSEDTKYAVRLRLFSKVWDACSQMNVAIQKLFHSKDRAILFGEGYEQAGQIQRYLSSASESGSESKSVEYGVSINDALLQRFNSSQASPNIEDVEAEGDDSAIIDFPNFLMHVFRLTYNSEYSDMHFQKKNYRENIPLNDNYLLSVYELIADHIDPMNFLNNLLYYRTILDRYIIKATNDESKEDGFRWSLEKPYTRYEASRNSNVLKFKSSFDNQIEIIKVQSMLQVTFRNKKYKNWLCDLLSFFSTPNTPPPSGEKYLDIIHRWLVRNLEETLKEMTEEKIFNAGTQTPHFLLACIDYLYWMKSVRESNNSKFDFEFKYRNSVEHHLPQSFSKKDNEKWIDNIGNLCLVSKSTNSRMNNEAPVGKASRDGKYYKKSLPPKQKVMYDHTNNHGSWGAKEIEEHYIDVKNLLKSARQILNVTI